jgi:hypothetical protein
MKKILAIFLLLMASVAMGSSSQSSWQVSTPANGSVTGAVMMTVDANNVPRAVSSSFPVTIQYAGATSVVAGQNALTAAGTAQQLSAASKPLLNSITIMANSNNSGKILLGAAGVNNTIGTAGTGFPLAPGQSVIWYGSNVNALYFNGTNTGDGVSYFGN